MANTAKGIYYPGSYASVADVPRDLKEMAESVDEAIEENKYDDEQIQQLIEDLQDKNAEQDTTIQKNTESIEALKAENERLNNDINAISVTERAEGENITLNDTAEARFKKFVPRGNSWQKTRSGKNKYLADKESFTYKGLTITNNGDGTYTINGTSTGAGDWWLKEYETNAFDVLAPICELKEGESASITFEVLSGNVEIITEVNNFSIAGKLSDTNKQNIAYRSINDIMTNKKISWTYTATESTVLANAQIYLSGEGNIFTNFKFRIQVELGTTATEYEQYGAMPSPDYKSDIQNVTGNANFKITNGLEDTDTNYEEQSFTFPLQEGQKLMLNDYLANDGIHHKRKQTSINSSLGNYNSNDNWYYISNSNFTNLINTSNSLSNYFTCKPISYLTSNSNASGVFSNTGTHFVFRISGFTSAAEYRNFFAENSVIIEHDIAEEEIEAYTEEQQAVYDEIKKTAHSYGEQTHIFCTDEISLIFNVEARKDMNTLLTRIERLESEV